jgi:integrase/recombinase XerD
MVFLLAEQLRLSGEGASSISQEPVASFPRPRQRASGVTVRRWEMLSAEEQAFIAPVIEEMKLRRFSRQTRKAYRNHLLRFHHFLQAPPHQVEEAEIRQYLLHLIDEKNISLAYQNQTISALKFYYQQVLRKDTVIEALPRPRPEKKLPVVLSRPEVLSLFEALDNQKHKTLLMLAYSSGLRVSEVVRLQIQDIDSQRDLIHIHQAKGRKDRYVPLSAVALEMLRTYWKTGCP